MAWWKWLFGPRPPQAAHLVPERPPIPPPELAIGHTVRVVLNERNHTPRVGTIYHIEWHFKNGCYDYYLEVNGKRISKRYLREDLEVVSGESQFRYSERNGDELGGKIDL